MSLREYQATLPEIIQYPDKTPFIHIDENRLDIFRRTEIEIPAWEPIQGVPEFDTCSYICLDIETTGLGNSNSKNYINVDFNPGLDVIKMVGMKSEIGSYRIFAGNDEKKILRQFVYVLEQKKPTYLFTYNGWNFDLPFLIARLDFYKIKHPFKYARKPSCMSAAQLFGKPQIFHQIFLSWEDGTQTYIIDLYFQVLAWDFVARKLVGWSLKTVPVQLELREESDRLELSYSDILEYYKLDDWDKLEIYLKDDLDDTERIAHHLFPAVHYQQLIIPEFNPQQLHIYGNGSKLNKFLTNFYILEGLSIPDTDEAHRFKGGRTEAFCGFFKNTTKCDVASLYPTIMLNYGLTSYKDTKNILLGALKYLTDVRLWHKANAKDESKSPEERRKSKQLEGAFKVIINSIYGFTGCKGLEFNDYKTAAMVTAYGRAILKFMMDHVLTHSDTIIVNMDTDAVAYSCPKGQERVIYESLKAALPEWVKIDFEWNADVFIPAVVKLSEFEKKYKLDSYHGKNFLQKWFENLTIAETQLCLMKFGSERVSLDLFFKISKMLDRDFLTSDGLRKNYIVFLNEGGVKLFGKYKKRDRSVLMKTFPVEYLTRYRNDPSSAEMYHEEVKAQITDGSYPVENLAITRKIRKGEKKLLEVFTEKDEGDVVTFYKTVEESFALLGSKESYSSEEYLEELEKLANEILDAIFIQSVVCKKDEESTLVAA